MQRKWAGVTLFFGFSSSTCGEEWSDCGRMEPVRPNGRETGLRFQPDGGQRGRTDI